jgi:hypothetical protein
VGPTRRAGRAHPRKAKMVSRRFLRFFRGHRRHSPPGIAPPRVPRGRLVRSRPTYISLAGGPITHLDLHVSDELQLALRCVPFVRPKRSTERRTSDDLSTRAARREADRWGLLFSVVLAPLSTVRSFQTFPRAALVFSFS